MYEILEKIASDPPSERVIEPSEVERIQAFLAVPERSETAIWNFLKEELDRIVRGSLASEFFVRLFDLEGAGWKAPPGGYAISDGSIERAPWRLDAARP